MIKFWIFMTVLIYLVGKGGADETSQNQPQRPPGVCLGIKGLLKEGVQITMPGHCVGLRCEPNGTIVHLSCSKIGLDTSKCHLSKEDLTKEYPDCCPQPICT